VLGILLVFSRFGTLDFQEIGRSLAPLAPEAAFGTISAITLLLFIGATGKSAQIPLFVWLPDAMEGPTPVSALIHAATMVTAGVYMVARLNFLFSMAPATMLVIATVGTLTAFFAATIGTTQDDIKKVLAYSTISQLGYMFAAVGVGAVGPRGGSIASATNRRPRASAKIGTIANRIRRPVLPQRLGLGPRRVGQAAVQAERIVERASDG